VSTTVLLWIFTITRKYYCYIIIYISHFVTLVIVYIITEGDFHAVYEIHVQDVRKVRPTFSSSANCAHIEEEAPRKVSQYIKLLRE
jgi:hypothetical protein